MEETTTPAPTIMSVGLKFGAILGLVSIIQSLIVFAIGSNPLTSDWKNTVVGIAISVAVIIFAQKAFKDGGDGYMSYGQGLGIAMVTSMIAIAIGMVFTFVYINFIDTTAFEAIWEKAAEDMEAKGQSQEQIDMGLEWGRKLFWVMYLIGGAFGSFIVGLIVTIFTQKKAPEQTF
ncbi:MAG TPA: DUF4199 domain-containing protein [Chryseolinea sp.]|nr:DUF4199 domain-containing protein [Chryseolinea sp.]HPM30290.1 DUF4199 domain-containing protein [Chryseolinea sp.]